MSRAIALVLALLATPLGELARPDAPEIAPRSVRCPTRHRSIVVVDDRLHYEDTSVKWIEDTCSRFHYHDASYETVRYRCLLCGKAWEREYSTPACACGWRRGAGNFHDPCADVDEAP